jgi:hypothetical protein
MGWLQIQIIMLYPFYFLAVNDLDYLAFEGEKHSVSPHSNDVRLEILDINARDFDTTCHFVFLSVCIGFFLNSFEPTGQIYNHTLSRDYTIYLDICDK